jgi:hypothetical protein
MGASSAVRSLGYDSATAFLAQCFALHDAAPPLLAARPAPAIDVICILAGNMHLAVELVCAPTMNVRIDRDFVMQLQFHFQITFGGKITECDLLKITICPSPTLNLKLLQMYPDFRNFATSSTRPYWV